MKKIILAFVAVAFLSGSAMAQWNIGARINDGWGLGAEFSAQKALSDQNRIELDLGLSWWGASYSHYMYTSVTGIYQWTFNIVGGFGWYVGPGAQIGLYTYNYDDGYYTDHDSYLRLAAVGQIGLEYNFDFPLQLTVDYRPGVDLLGFNGHGAFVHSYAVGVRYRF